MPCLKVSIVWFIWGEYRKSFEKHLHVIIWTLIQSRNFVHHFTELTWTLWTYRTAFNNSAFSQTHKIGKTGIIAKFVFPDICSILLYLQHMMSVNMTWDITGCKRITFQGCRPHWSSFFLITQLKQIWQYRHSCIVESFWKTLFEPWFR